MYAVHFVLFVGTLVLSHIIQLCLKPYVKHGEPGQSTDEPNEQNSTTEEEESCRFAPWSGWSECTVTCGDGISVRHRVILILDNCTGDMVQERVCSENPCPHDREFIFRRKDDDSEQPSDDGDYQPHSENIRSNDGNEQHTTSFDSNSKGEDLNQEKTEDDPGGRVSSYKDVPHGPFNYDDANFDKGGEQEEEETSHERPRGYSWTSDEGNTWGRQSSFESYGGDDDNCFSDCSPGDPPASSFKQDEKPQHGNDQEDAEPGQEKGEEKRDEGRSGKDEKDSFREEGGNKGKDKSKHRESFKNNDEHSDNEDKRYDAETDFDDDDDFDDGDDDDDGFDEDDDAENEGRKKRQDEEAEDVEQDDLEQDEEEEEEESRKGRRRRRKRRRKRKPKQKTNEREINNTTESMHVCDPTEISDTFMNIIDGHSLNLDTESNVSTSAMLSATSDATTLTSAANENEDSSHCSASTE